MSKKKDSRVLKLDKVPEGSRLERYLKQLPKVMKDHKAFGFRLLDLLAKKITEVIAEEEKKGLQG